MSDRLGQQLGNYLLTHFIGRGGFADVYLGEHVHLKTQAAIKILHARLAKSDEDNFQQEALIIARLIHPNIVRILDFAIQDGTPFLVMDYAPNGTLRTRHPRGVPLSPTIILPYVKQVAAALQYAHDQRVIHRDIKPENMLLGTRNDVLLSDFGIAVVAQSSRYHNPTDVAGTIIYMAPEQIQAQPRPASDQYALAVIVYEWLTGNRLFDGPYNEIAIKHTVTPPPSLRNQVPGIPPALEDVVMTALAKDPAARFVNIQAFATAFEQACQNEAWWQVAETQIINLSAPPTPPSASGQYTPVISSPYFTPNISAPSATPVPSASQGPSAPPPLSSTPSAANTPFMPTIPGTLFPPPPQPAPPFAYTPTPQPAAPAAPGPAAPPAFPAGFTPAFPAGSGPAAGAPPHAPPASGTPKRSPRRRILYGSLAGFIVLASFAGVLLGIALSKHQVPPQNTGQSVLQATQKKVTSFGTRTVTNLPVLKNTPPQKQLTLPARLRLTGDQATQATEAAANLQQLPALPQNISPTLGNAPSPQKDNLLPKLHRLLPGQAQLGLDSPANTSVATFGGSSVADAVDGVLVIDTRTATYTISFADFFAPMLHPQEVLGEPRILFDLGTLRWVVVMNQLQLTGNAVAAGFFDVAFSATSDPASDWFLYQFSTQVTAYSGCNWADYPQVAADTSGVFITGTNFACGQNGKLDGATLWELPKSNFALGAGGSLYAWAGFKTGAGNPVVTLTPAAEEPLAKTAWFLSDDAGYVDAGQTSKQVMIWAAEEAAENTEAAPTIEKATITLTYPYADPPTAIQPGTAPRLNTSDARIQQVQFTEGHLYTAFTTAVNWSGDTATRSGIYWLDLVPSVQSATGQLSVKISQQGVFGFSQSYVFNPYFVSDGLGNTFLFSEAASQTLYPSVVFTSHLRSDAADTLGQTSGAFLLDTGKTSFTGSHWGDYRGGCFTMANGNRTLILYTGLTLSGQTTQWQPKTWEVVSPR